MGKCGLTMQGRSNEILTGVAMPNPPHITPFSQVSLQNFD